MGAPIHVNSVSGKRNLGNEERWHCGVMKKWEMPRFPTTLLPTAPVVTYIIYLKFCYLVENFLLTKEQVAH